MATRRREPACPVGRFLNAEVLKPLGFKEPRSGEFDSAAPSDGAQRPPEGTNTELNGFEKAALFCFGVSLQFGSNLFYQKLLILANAFAHRLRFQCRRNLCPAKRSAPLNFS